MRTTGLALVIPLSLALLLAGCAAPSGTGSEPSDSDTPTPSESTPAPEADWAVTASSIGAIHLGDSRADVEAALADAGLAVDDAASCPNPNVIPATDPVSGIRIWTVLDDAGSVLLISAGGALLAGPNTDAVHTAEGIALGSPYADVPTTYPAATELMDYPGYVLEAPEGWITFQTQAEQTVDGITVGAGVSAPNEYCG